jgi:hypothetical protein
MHSSCSVKRVVVVAAAAAGTLLVACSMLTGLDAEYTERSATDAADSSPTTHVAEPNGTELDAGADAAPTDAATDANDAAWPAAFCATKDAGANGFCWDFEGPAGPPNWGWTDNSTVGGALTVVTGTGRNTSRVLRATVTNARSASGNAFLHHSIPGGSFISFRHHELNFAYSVVRRASLYTISLGLLGFGGGGTQYAGASVYAVPSADGLIDVSNPPGDVNGTSVAVTLGDWKTVHVALNRSGNTNTYAAQVSVDGVAVEDAVSTINAGTSTAPTQIWIGAFYSALGDGGVEALIDNVIVRQDNTP